MYEKLAIIISFVENTRSLHIIEYVAFSEWRSGHAGRLVMQDLDASSEMDGTLRRLNTLKHYNVPRRVTLALVDISPASPSLASSAGQFNTTSSQQKLTINSKGKDPRNSPMSMDL